MEAFRRACDKNHIGFTEKRRELKNDKDSNVLFIPLARLTFLFS
jgi:hypothetical protein